MKPIPQKRLIFLFLIPLCLTVFAFIDSTLLGLAFFVDLLIVIFALIDLILSYKSHNFLVEVDEGGMLSIGRTNDVSITCINNSAHQLTAEFTLPFPDHCKVRIPVAKSKIEGKTKITFTFKIRPMRRGVFHFENVYLRIPSKYNLFSFIGKKHIVAKIEVFPDVKALHYFIKLFKTDKLYQLGIHKNRWKGQGSELESLREYNKDDNSKLIDWKASTRINKPVVKLLEMETNNHLVIAIDCGRMMTAEQNGLSSLDHAVNSLLILAHLAIRAGDTITVIAYADNVQSVLKEVKGKSSLNKITYFITKLESKYVESNYNLIFRYLQKTVKRRSFVIFLSDIVDDVNKDLFKKGIYGLSRKHFLLFVFIRDTLLDYHAEKRSDTPDQLYQNTAAREMILNRISAIELLKHSKVHFLDILPKELNSALINKYLEVKQRNRL